ncbi:hypothetical protein CR513_30429, partial [Mucuna pruriens]
MALEDKDKTTFITTWGTFCYKVMSFGLKNNGATYQRAMCARLRISVKQNDAESKCRVLTHLGCWLSCYRQRLSRYDLGRDLFVSDSTDSRFDAIDFINPSPVQFLYPTSKSILALGIFMTIAKGSSIAIPRNYKIATSSVGRDYVQGLDLMTPSSMTITMSDGDGSPSLARSLRIKSTRVRW